MGYSCFMKNNIYISFLLFLLVTFTMVSCSKSVFKSKTVEPERDNARRRPSEVNRYELSAEKDDDKKDKSWDEIVEQAEKKDKFEKIREREDAEQPDMDIGRFSASESQHVKMSNYDPFSGKEYLMYDLFDMAKSFRYPCDGKLISNYGMRGRSMHSGVDIKASYGDNIYAAFDGVVRMSKYYEGYGNIVVIRHNNGLETVYGHNSKNKVSVNQKVKAGDVIALAGRTGRASTEHLHFEVRVQGQYFNPNLLIDVVNNKLQSNKLYVYKRGSTIVASNKLSNNSVQRDDVAEVKTPDKKVESSVKNNTAATAVEKDTGNGVYHKIKSGDTLYGLALKYKTTVNSICKLNGISSTKTLSLGQMLRIK